MKIIRNISEEEVVATFLKTELVSPRFKHRYSNLSRKHIAMINNPNLKSKLENKYRSQLLSKTRGYPDRRIFTNFPKNVSWKRAYLSKKELQEVQYIDYDYWNELSGGSRLPKDAAKNIRAGKTVFGHSNQNFKNMAKAVEKGIGFPELILVSTDKGGKMVALEGHARLTAFMLALKHIPNKIEVIIGFSKKMKKWDLYKN